MPLLEVFPRFGKLLDGVTDFVFGCENHPDVELCADDSADEEEDVFADAGEFVEVRDSGTDCREPETIWSEPDGASRKISCHDTELGTAADEPVAPAQGPVTAAAAVGEEHKTLYAVALTVEPVPLQCNGEAEPPVRIFQQLKDAIAFCKVHKSAGPRLKQVADSEEAEAFFSQLRDTSARSDLNENSVAARTMREALAWRTPQSQETVNLRKCIESGTLEDVRTILSSNPCFLISSGDTPTVLQEGCHYNAFHIATRANRPDMLSLILDTLRSKDFFRKMYPDDSDETTDFRMAFLIDRYLNTPDKTRSSETPLHFACKFGALECVRLLLNQAECDRTVRNGEGLQAVDIVCDRAAGQPLIARKIRALFEERFVIPIVRDDDGDCLARVGSPMPPRELDSAVVRSPLQCSPRSRKSILSAAVGPVSSPVAEEVVADLNRLRKQELRIRLSDAEKGLESLARQVARRHGVPWTERWDFLDQSVDLLTAEGLEAFENYLRTRFHEPTRVTFIMGQFPTKTDYHVWNALEPIVEGIDETQLAFVGRWITNMRPFSKDDMAAWKTPVKNRPVLKDRGAGDDVNCLVNLMKRFSTKDLQ